MPVSPTYPGVYIQELPSGNRTIVGVATSITAFVGRALRGPVNEPTRVSSAADFSRKFGGLWVKSPMTYAVQQYFLAGGRDALIVRVVSSAVKASVTLDLDATSLRLRAQAVGEAGNATVATVTHGEDDVDHFILQLVNGETTENYHVTMDPDDADGTKTYIDDLPAAVAAGQLATVVGLPTLRPDEVTSQALSGGSENTYAAGTLTVTYSGGAHITLHAANEGDWGNYLQAAIDYDTSDTSDAELFNLSVDELDTDGNTIRSEVFRNVSLNSSHKRYLATVLDEQSKLLELATPSGTVPGHVALRPLQTEENEPLPLTGGINGNDLTQPDIIPALGSTTGIYALEQADIFNMLVIPPPTFTDGDDIDASGWAAALTYCEGRRAVCLVDAPAWVDADAAETGVTGLGLTSEYGAIFYPRVKIADPLRENRMRTCAPGGVVAGIIAKTDAQRGVWKAPAGLDARAPIVRGTSVKLTDSDNGRLNPLGLNCFRTFPSAGTVLWGARTLAGADRLASDWKYLPVRRTALYIEESLYRGLQWAVFEPNDEPLWAQIRLAAGGFMHQLFRQQAFQGASPKDAYFVKCDGDTTTQADIDRGIVNVVVGFAPLKPAEFVVISIQQIAGQAAA